MKKTILKIWPFLLGAGMVVFISFIYYYTSKDKNDIKNSEALILEIQDLRVAIASYYEKTKEFPDLIDNKDKLSSIVFTKKDGTRISFAKIYGRDSLPQTPTTSFSEKTNRIIDTSDFKNTDLQGGWCYDFSGNTGEIHINLPYNALNQGVEWINY